MHVLTRCARSLEEGLFDADVLALGVVELGAELHLD
jgi:hypothetical protein